MRKEVNDLNQRMRLADLRRKALLTQEDLAEKIGVTRPCISLYETGQRRIPVSLLPAIKDALGCTWEELFGETEEND